MTTMQVRTFLKVAPLLPKTTSVLLRGAHGIGKSQVVRHVAGLIASAEGLTNFEVIDRRLSQMSEGDMIGLPSTDGEVTRFNPPEWYKRACDKPVCLFLDELNRATPEVMQAAFQVVLDRELNGWKLHPQTRVFAAINTGGNYTVNEMDPALLDRFWAIDLTPDVQDWVTWAKESKAVHDNVVTFITGNEKWLDPPRSGDSGAVSPSRRSWERLSHALVSVGVADQPDNNLFYPLCLGYVGTEATIAFHDYVKTIEAQVSGKEILEEYPKVKAKIARLGQEKLNVAIEKLADYITKNVSIVNDVQGQNLRDFMEHLPAELRVAAWSKFTAHGIEKLELTKSIHKWCVTSILEALSVPKEDVEKVQATTTGKTTKKAKAK
jgi:energy-coupling factor transporter ATP-binding protein EcfA2